MRQIKFFRWLEKHKIPLGTEILKAAGWVRFIQSVFSWLCGYCGSRMIYGILLLPLFANDSSLASFDIINHDLDSIEELSVVQIIDPDSLVNIAEYLSPTEAIYFSQTCKHCNSIQSSQILWFHFCKNFIKKVQFSSLRTRERENILSALDVLWKSKAPIEWHLFYGFLEKMTSNFNRNTHLLREYEVSSWVKILDLILSKDCLLKKSTEYLFDQTLNSYIRNEVIYRRIMSLPFYGVGLTVAVPSCLILNCGLLSFLNPFISLTPLGLVNMVIIANAAGCCYASILPLLIGDYLIENPRSYGESLIRKYRKDVGQIVLTEYKDCFEIEEIVKFCLQSSFDKDF